MTRRQWIWVGAALVVLAVFGYIAVRVSVRAGSKGTQPVPGKQAEADPFYPANVVQPVEHPAGYVFTPHRYPNRCGGEVSAAIHQGFSSMRVPAGTPDVQWLIAPPSEVSL